jgi:endonuclease-3 related protein
MRRSDSNATELGPPSIRTIFDSLLAQHGPQGWWPADDRFEILVGAVLVQRTAWLNAALAIERLKSAALLSVDALVDAKRSLVEEAVRPAGFFRVKASRLHALAGFVRDVGGLSALTAQPTPRLREALLAQPGIGPETADAILAYAFDRPVFVVDAYARRLFERLGSPVPRPADPVLRDQCERSLGRTAELKEFHALIVAHGQRHCSSVPLCNGCSLSTHCGRVAMSG